LEKNSSRQSVLLPQFKEAPSPFIKVSLVKKGERNDDRSSRDTTLDRYVKQRAHENVPLVANGSRAYIQTGGQDDHIEIQENDGRPNRHSNLYELSTSLAQKPSPIVLDSTTQTKNRPDEKDQLPNNIENPQRLLLQK